MSGSDRATDGRAPEDPTEDPADEELAVRSIELDTEDGGTVVIAQQNMGGRRQSGGGEYKNVDHAPSVEEAEAEQELVDASTSEPHEVDDRDPSEADAADGGERLDAVDEPNREQPGATTAWRTDDDTPA